MFPKQPALCVCVLCFQSSQPCVSVRVCVCVCSMFQEQSAQTYMRHLMITTWLCTSAVRVHTHRHTHRHTDTRTRTRTHAHTHTHAHTLSSHLTMNFVRCEESVCACVCM